MPAMLDLPRSNRQRGNLMDWRTVIDILSALLTPAIAIVVAYIAYAQWRTANARLNLDLFDKRLAVYRKVHDAVGKVNATGLAEGAAEALFLEAQREARFLFGPEVKAYLDELWMHFIQLHAAQSNTQSTDEDVRKRAVQRQSELFQEITQFYYEGGDVFAPYLQMDQRLRAPKRRRTRRPAAG
jgi:hypothetical protein